MSNPTEESLVRGGITSLEPVCPAARAVQRAHRLQEAKRRVEALLLDLARLLEENSRQAAEIDEWEDTHRRYLEGAEPVCPHCGEVLPEVEDWDLPTTAPTPCPECERPINVSLRTVRIFTVEKADEGEE